MLFLVDCIIVLHGDIEYYLYHMEHHCASIKWTRGEILCFCIVLVVS